MRPWPLLFLVLASACVDAADDDVIVPDDDSTGDDDTPGDDDASPEDDDSAGDDDISDDDSAPDDDSAGDDDDAPQAPTLILVLPLAATLPEAPLVLRADITDADSALDSLVVTWDDSVAGALGSGAPNPYGVHEIAGVSLSPGPHTLTVRVTDPTGLGAEASVDLVIDAAPSPPGITLDPATPTTEHDLTLLELSAASDPEGAPLTLAITWSRDGVVVPSLEDLPFVPAAETGRGELWAVEVRADDGVQLSAPALASTLILNAAPRAASATLGPSVAPSDGTLEIAVHGAEDADGDTILYDVNWFSDGVFHSSGTTLTRPAADFTPGAAIHAEVQLSDGFDPGSFLVTGTARRNQLPTASGGGIVIAGPSLDARETSTLSIDPVLTVDADGDTVLTTYEWLVDAVVNTAPLLSGADFDRFQQVQLRVTLDDGVESVGPQVVASLTVQNSPPEITAHTASPQAPTVLDDVSCAASVADADGDVPSLTLSWARTSPAGGPTLSSSTLPASSAAPGEGWTCTALADDGFSTAMSDLLISPCAGAQYFVDADLDGAGDPAQPLWECGASLGVVGIADDCDDTDSSVVPLGGDVGGDGFDDDCDGLDCDADTLPFLFAPTYVAICPTAVDGLDARSLCDDAGYDSLLSIRSGAEQDVLWDFFVSRGLTTSLSPWIGLTDELFENSFGWLDGSSAGYRNWSPTEPNNIGDEDCVQFNHPLGNGGWNDRGCSIVPSPSGVICQVR